VKGIMCIGDAQILIPKNTHDYCCTAANLLAVTSWHHGLAARAINNLQFARNV